MLDATFALPEFGPGATFPGAMAIGFHFVDYVVHGWDVARSIGAPFELPRDVIEAVLPIAFAVPDGEFRTEEGSPFRRAVAVDDEASDMDRILAHLGRSPAWTSPCAPALIFCRTPPLGFDHAVAGHWRCGVHRRQLRPRVCT